MDRPGEVASLIIWSPGGTADEAAVSAVSGDEVASSAQAEHAGANLLMGEDGYRCRCMGPWRRSVLPRRENSREGADQSLDQLHASALHQRFIQLTLEQPVQEASACEDAPRRYPDSPRDGAGLGPLSAGREPDQKSAPFVDEPQMASRVIVRSRS